MMLLNLLRQLGLVEGLSFLILLFVAMPLKYVAGWPLAVKWVGWAHGGLFLLYGLLLAVVFFKYRWPFLRTITALAAALFPFGPFLLDAHMQRWIKECRDFRPRSS